MYKIGDENRATSASYELVWKSITSKKKILDHLRQLPRLQIHKKCKQYVNNLKISHL